jgi:hypothetical protein
MAVDHCVDCYNQDDDFFNQKLFKTNFQQIDCARVSMTMNLNNCSNKNFATSSLYFWYKCIIKVIIISVVNTLLYR